MKTTFEFNRLIYPFQVTLNILFTAISILLAYRLSSNFMMLPEFSFNLQGIAYILLALLFLTSLFVFNAVPVKRESKRKLFLNHVKANTITALIAILVAWATNNSYVAIVYSIVFTFINLWVLYALNAFYSNLLTRIFQGNVHLKNVFLIGGKELEPLIAKFANNNSSKYSIVGIATSSSYIQSKYKNQFNMYSPDECNASLIKGEVIDQVLSFDDVLSFELIQSIAECCYQENIDFYLNTREVEILSEYRLQKTMFENITFYSVTNKELQSEDFTKNIFEIIITSFLLMLTSPVMVIIAVLVALTSKGAAILKYRTIGLHGRLFYSYKFRTFIITDKNQLTKLGHILVKYKLDILPQLFNVLMGNMNLRGPKPAIIENKFQHKKMNSANISVKPGISKLNFNFI